MYAEPKLIGPFDTIIIKPNISLRYHTSDATADVAAADADTYSMPMPLAILARLRLFIYHADCGQHCYNSLLAHHHAYFMWQRNRLCSHPRIYMGLNTHISHAHEHRTHTIACVD